MLGWCAALAFGLTAACRGDQPKESIELVVPDGSGRTYELVPRSAFAEYVEVPDVTNELRVTFATHDVSCERYVAPGPDDTVLVVTLRMPPNDKPRPGSFATTPPLADDAGAKAVPRAYAVPVIRRKDRGYSLPPGGSMELSLVDLGRAGRVSGSLAFEFPGDATRPASSAKGKFTARLCRSEEAPGTR
ncbi:MAG TPA: hypothetical protein VMS65_15060 [Polyangiaceae bacterium]|nr:hypothetical protein [Polyangiaceae bacterium]